MVTISQRSKAAEMSQDKLANLSSIEEAHVENTAKHEPQTYEERYIFERHGTLDLIPMPSADPADPLNWPAWKVRQ